MEFLRINGVVVPAEIESPSMQIPILNADRYAENGMPILQRKKLGRSWPMISTTMVAEDAHALRGLLSGMGHRFSLKADLWSTRGKGPVAVAGATFATTGRWSGVCATLSATVQWDFSEFRTQAIRDQWTVLVYRLEGSTWVRYAIRSDGAVFQDGVRTYTVAVGTWFTMDGGILSLSPDGAITTFDDLVVLYFKATDAQILAWHEWQTTGRQYFSDLPFLTAEGAFIDGRSVSVVGEFGGGDYQTFAPSTANRAGTYWRNNSRKIQFTLHEKYTSPALLLPRPDIHLNFESLTAYNMAAYSDTLSFSGTTDGQVTTAYRSLLVGGGITYPTSRGNYTNSSRFSLMCWVRFYDPTAVGTRLVILGKYGAGVPGYCLMAMSDSSGNLLLRGGLTNGTAHSAGRLVEATSDYFSIEEWHHVGLAYDGSDVAAGVELYLDGARIAKTTLLDTASGSISNVVGFGVGRAAAGVSADQGNAAFEEVAVFPSKLSDGQFKEAYRLGSLRRTLQWTR